MDYNPLSVLIVDDEASIRSGLSKAINGISLDSLL